ncbi:hypothetical protein [Rurimicrobium arvi]|uniref:YtxH domain-containing protein n=1 Tax=Rurimicrobium arvi TaxID=2049916 RepID=A0ABP8MXH5_9BACT
MKGTTLLLLGGVALLGSWAWSKKMSPENKKKVKDLLRNKLTKHLPDKLQASL